MKRECALRGEAAVVSGCVNLLTGHETTPELIYALGGPPARWAIDGGESGPDYWMRVWAARGLLYAYDDSAASAVVAALADDHWRVREMASRVCGRQRIDTALPQLALLTRDEGIRFLTERDPQSIGRALHQNMYRYDHSYVVLVPDDCTHGA